jgi:hypothetical protein
MDAITLGETCKKKRDTDPSCNFKLVYLSNFDSIGKQIIEKGCTVRGKYFPCWEPQHGILNIFEKQQF